MIFGTGCDIVEISRFKKWVGEESPFIERFFNPNERAGDTASEKRKCEFYAGRFAAKEAFSKALGTGISGFNLNEVYVAPDGLGKPVFHVTGKALETVEKMCGKDYRIHVSISHEKEYAVANVIIEILK